MNKALVISDKKKILVRDAHPDRLTTVIPTAKKFVYKGVELVSIPHELDETKVLNNLGFDIPSPVETYYHWPSRYESPMYVQKVTTGNMTLDTRHFVLNDLGTGKTLSCLWAFDYLRSIGKATKMLVVTPLSTMESVWANEVWEHLPHLQTQVLYGDAKKRVAQLEFPADIYIINHDGLKVPEVLKALIERKDITVLCVDELADFKNAGTDRFTALKKLSAGREYFWGLTGTPIPNKVTDAWAQCQLINPARVSKYFGQFRELVMRKVSQFKWVPRINALEVVKEAMQPATLFRRDECMDLPPTMWETRFIEMSPEQKKAYKQMMNTLVAEAGAGQIVAVNEAVKISKLAQIACISINTPVLCKRGWVLIQEVDALDIVWDGVEWVNQCGAVLKGFKPVVECGGVRVTQDHELLTEDGWKSALEINNAWEKSCEFNWTEVRVPDSYGPCMHRGPPRSFLDVQMRLWSRDNDARTASKGQSVVALRLSERRPQYDQKPPIHNMVWNEATVLKSVRCRVGLLWRSWHNSVSRMGEVISNFLERYALRILKKTNTWSEGQQWWVQQRQLPVGNYAATIKQHQDKYCSTHTGRYDDPATSCNSLQNRSPHSSRKNFAQRLVSFRRSNETSTKTPVYDLINCGPRNRFVVKGIGGELRIVHNCGVAYGVNGEDIHINAPDRITELKTLVEASEGKVIVFVPLTGALHSIADELRKDWKVEVVYGDVSKKERDRIFAEFKQPDGTHVIVAHPRCMSHGLTLVEANTIIWFIPTNNPNDYTQANGRITRPGQKRNTFIIHLEGSEVERRMYKALKDKGTVQGVLLDLIKEDLSQ